MDPEKQEMLGVDFKDLVTKSQAIRDLFELLEKDKIELPQGIVDRLKLLDTPKCSEGECIFTGEKEYKVVTTTGEEKYKKNETHLEHTLELVKILKILLPFFLKLEDLENDKNQLTKKIITAAILHDIGKTGPEIGSLGEKIDPEVNQDFVLLFSLFEKRKKEEGGKNLAELSIREAIEKHVPLERQERVLNSIQKVRIPRKKHSSGQDVFFDPDNNYMKDIFGAHVEFSLEILQEYKKRDELAIDPLVLLLVAKHHEIGNSYNYKPHPELLNSLPDEVKTTDGNLAVLIELADTFQAMSSRGEQKNTLSTLDKMEEKYKKMSSHGLPIPDIVFTIIQKIRDNESIVKRLDETKE